MRRYCKRLEKEKNIAIGVALALALTTGVATGSAVRNAHKVSDLEAELLHLEYNLDDLAYDMYKCTEDMVAYGGECGVEDGEVVRVIGGEM